ncbi:MAG: DNA adenine methylase [Helicobacteraceae bacterium]|jgi:DNA adenine methylase|nr:DNA adenine methylase [Helicobacteraceae bacterium]
MKNNKLVAPVLKWVGGKRQLLDALRPLLPKEITTYCEPFVGGGALLFQLQPTTAFINDINAELINVYQAIKDDVENLINALQEFKNEENMFYSVRDWDRNKKEYASLSDIKKAARILYLNKTCYNGLFRVNSAGEFNAPFGNHRNPNIVNAPTLRAVSAYFNSADVRLTSIDYAEVLKELPKDAFVYLDPPYDPVSDTSSFTGYAKGGFTRDDQIRLRECCDELNSRGLKFMLSNSATDFIKEQYAAYHITIARAKRAINSDSTKRGEINEVAVRNYK